MALLFYRAIRCRLAEFLYYIISRYPPAGSSTETVSILSVVCAPQGSAVLRRFFLRGSSKMVLNPYRYSHHIGGVISFLAWLYSECGNFFWFYIWLILILQ